jgi:antitoxin (DNA-binding transcriptional repressor) of toxin-antitoxin stability system
MIVDLLDVQANLGQLIDKANLGEEIVIRKDPSSAVRLVPVRPLDRRGPRAGSVRGLIVLGEDFDEPLADFDPYTR